MNFKRDDIPDEPGCYLYKDESGTILYVGKAKNLKKRVSSYFQKRHTNPRLDLLVSQIKNIDFIVTSTEVEALILENTLIKKYQPKFNIDLKDAKSYAYIHITNEKYPRICIAREQKGKKSGILYGPFVSASERDQILHFIKQTFRIRTCKNMSHRACLRYHLGTCSAPCSGKISEPDYQYLIKNADLLLKGKNKDLLEQLRIDMHSFSDTEEYEKALNLRDMISAIERLSEHQNVKRQKTSDEHIINFMRSGDMIYLILFQVERGTLTGKEEFIFKYSEDFLEEFIIQYYSTVKPPKELIMPDFPEDIIAEYLTQLRGSQVVITIPKQGEKKELLNLVLKNIEASFFRGKIRITELGEALHLDNPPEVIECFDISHLGGTGTVGSMVTFRDGKPDKSNYRRYRVKTAGPSDDYAAIREVVKRRYSRLIKEKRDLPDLIIIDGGPGQLQSAKEIMDELEISVPLISIAKREEEIYRAGDPRPLGIPVKNPASLIVQEIRDEAHRFAITYQKKLRQKRMRE